MKIVPLPPSHGFLWELTCQLSFMSILSILPTLSASSTRLSRVIRVYFLQSMSTLYNSLFGSISSLYSLVYFVYLVHFSKLYISSLSSLQIRLLIVSTSANFVSFVNSTILCFTSVFFGNLSIRRSFFFCLSGSFCLSIQIFQRFLFSQGNFTI